jgi:hypothetical protein
MDLALSNTAFWDVNLSELNATEHADYIIARVFEYGTYNDMRVVMKAFSEEKMIGAFKKYRGFSEPTKSLIKVWYNLKNEDFLGNGIR